MPVIVAEVEPIKVPVGSDPTSPVIVVVPVLVMPLPASTAKLSAAPSDTEVAAKVFGVSVRKDAAATIIMAEILKPLFEKIDFFKDKILSIASPPIDLSQLLAPNDGLLS